MPNYGMNPTTPDPKGEISAIPPQPAQPGPGMRPRSIREYLQMLGANRQMREQAGAVPRFTDRPDTPLHGQGPTHTILEKPQGAISEAKSRYESVPYEERGQFDPYERLKMRLPEILPEIWQAAFPGRPQGDMLSDEEMEVWRRASMNVTNSLLEKYDREHGDFKRRRLAEKEEGKKSTEGWQKTYWELFADGKLPRDEQGNPVPEDKWVRERIQAATKLKGGDTPSNIKGGRKITGQDIAKIMQDPQYRELADSIRSSYAKLSQQIDPDEAKRRALVEHQEQIMSAIGQE